MPHRTCEMAIHLHCYEDLGCDHTESSMTEEMQRLQEKGEVYCQLDVNSCSFTLVGLVKHATHNKTNQGELTKQKEVCFTKC